MAGNTATSVIKELTALGVVGSSFKPKEAAESTDDMDRLRSATSALYEAMAALAANAKQVQETVALFQNVLEESMAEAKDDDDDDEKKDDDEEEDEE